MVNFYFKFLLANRNFYSKSNFLLRPVFVPDTSQQMQEEEFAKDPWLFLVLLIYQREMCWNSEK